MCFVLGEGGAVQPGWELQVFRCLGGRYRWSEPGQEYSSVAELKRHEAKGEVMDEQQVAFRAQKDDLAHAIAVVARNLPNKPPQPVLRAIVITADDEGIEFAGYDYELSNRVRISAEVLSNGRVAVAGRLLNEIVGNLPPKPVEFEIEQSLLVVTCGSARFELPQIPLDDYPPLPTMPQLTGSVHPMVFYEAIDQVAKAAGTDDALPMLTGIYMEIEGEEVTLTATDRFRLARRSFQWTPADPEVSGKVLIPAKTLSGTAHAMNVNSSNPVEIALGSSDRIGLEMLGLNFDQHETCMRILDTDFPNVAPLLPKFHSSMASVHAKQLTDAIQRLQLVADRAIYQINMHFTADEMVLSAGGSDAGHGQETLPCSFIGRDEMKISFNGKFLKEGIQCTRSEHVVFGFNEPSRPAILLPEPEVMPELNEDNTYPSPDVNFTYLLMPVRMPA